MWRMQAYVDAIRRRVERMRAAAGPNTDFVLDANGTLTPGDAGFIATALERNHLLWFDEPTERPDERRTLAKSPTRASCRWESGRRYTKSRPSRTCCAGVVSTSCVPASG